MSLSSVRRSSVASGVLFWLCLHLCLLPAAVQCRTSSSSSVVLSYPLLPLNSTEQLLNPERGWYYYTELSTLDGTLSGQLTAEELSQQRVGGVTLIHRMFILHDYTAHLSSISPAYLQAIQADFSLLRSAGLKAVIRFCYTVDYTPPPYHDADPQTVQRHIAQVAPILQANLDVIAVVEGGWVGVWGETYYTSYYGDQGVVNATNWAARKAVLDAMLAAVGPDHFVAVRNVGQVRTLYSATPLTVSHAYQSNYSASRVSLHDDCFLAPYGDEGTFADDSDQVFLAANSAYTPVGGETCEVNPPDSNCSSALDQLAAYHWYALPLTHLTVVHGAMQAPPHAHVASQLIHYSLAVLPAGRT